MLTSLVTGGLLGSTIVTDGLVPAAGATAVINFAFIDPTGTTEFLDTVGLDSVDPTSVIEVDNLFVGIDATRPSLHSSSNVDPQAATLVKSA